MSNENEKQCLDFWNEVDFEFQKALSGFTILQDGTEPFKKLIETYCKPNLNWVGNEGVNRANLNILKHKNQQLNDLSKLEKDLIQSQKSEVSNVALASTLGPAAGIGAGLSLFPLMTKLLKR